jgi:hypothetical protein
LATRPPPTQPPHPYPLPLRSYISSPTNHGVTHGMLALTTHHTLSHTHPPRTVTQ